MLYFFIMDLLFKSVERFEKLNIENLMLFLSRDTQFIETIIYLNTEQQLFQDGVRSDGSNLGDYQPFTIEKKKIKGQPYDHVTLKDSGDFYKSFNVYLDQYRDLNIAAYPWKGDSLESINLFEQWGADILGLTGESLEVLRTLALEKAQQFISSELKKAA